MILIELIYNLALLVALSVVSGFIDTRWKRNTRAGVLLQGVLFGGAAVIGMLRPFVFAPGLVFDGRSVMISLGGLFFGPWTAAVACLMTIPLRLAQGGSGAAMGVLVILASAAIGAGYHLRWTRKAQELSTGRLFGFGVVVHLAMLAMTAALPPELIVPVLKRIGWPVMLAYPLATVLIGKILCDQEARGRFLTSLQLSEERYRELVEHAQSVILRLKPDGTITFCNEFALQFFGYTAAEILGRNVVGTIVPATDTIGKDLAAMVRDLGAHPERYSRNENENMRKDGSRCWLAWSNQGIQDEAGHCVALLCVGTDITERKRAQEALRESEAEFRAMFEVASIGMAQADVRTGQWLRVNQKMCAISGYPAEEMLRMRVPELTHPDDRQRDWELFQQVVRGDQPNYHLEKRYVRKDGAVVWVSVNMTMVRDAAGQPRRSMATIEDITERKGAEEALAKERTLLRTLVDLLPTLIFVKDREGRFLVANAACARYMGVASPQELIGKSDADFYRPEVAAGFRADERKVLEGTPVVDREEGAALPGGTRRFLLTNKVPLRDGGGNIIGLVGTCLDITERRRAEAEKEKLEAQFQQAQKMETVGRLAGGVAHDFNNMLQAILSHVDLALTDAPPGSALRESIEEIQKSAQRSAALTRQLLAFARKQAIAPRVLDLNETVEGLLKLLHRLIGENIQLRWVPGAGLGPVKLDPTQVDQVLANLCVNARDAIGGVGKITIATENASFDDTYCAEHPGFLPGAYVRLVVSDTGCGMDKATQAQIFEPFFTTKDVGEGTGLGLATVYGIVKQNQGFIHVYSEPGKGTSFSIYLPRHAGQALAAQPKSAAKMRRSTGETVLLVEDEPSILAIAQKVLDRLGYTVLAAATPGKALQLAEAHAGKIHLLMTDVVMPEMNGRDLARELLARKPETKCLFMSGYAADVIVHQGVIEKGVQFIQKPFTMADLAAKVRETLEH